MHMTTKEEAVTAAVRFLKYVENEPEKFEDDQLFQAYIDNAGFQSWMLGHIFENKKDELTEEDCKEIETEQLAIFEEALSIFNDQKNELEKLNNNLSNLRSKLEEWSNWLSDFSLCNK